MDCSKEALLDELSDFERQRPAEIPAVLDEYLCQVAKTGDTIFPWHRLKPLLCRKLEMVMNEFYEAFPTDTLPVLPNVEAFQYEDMKAKILETLDTFTSAPFTIQRLCELVVDPRKHYRRTDKFMRGVEKNVLVVSTVEPKSASAQQQSPGTPLVNGVPGIEELGINGHSANEAERTRLHAVDPERENHPAKMDAVENVASLEEVALPYDDSSNARLDDEKEAGGPDIVDDVPVMSEESTISQAEAKEPTAVPPEPAEPNQGKSPGSETQVDNLEQTAAKDETKGESASDEVSSTGDAIELESVAQNDGEDSSADSEAAAAVDECGEAESASPPETETAAEKPGTTELNLGTSSKLEERSSFNDDEAGPPLKKFHSEGHGSFEENVDSLDSKQSGVESTRSNAAIDDSSLPVEEGSGVCAVVQNVDMVEEPSDVSSTDGAPGIAVSQSLAEDEPMDQD